MNKYYNAEKSARLKKMYGDKYYLHWNDPEPYRDFTEPKEIEKVVDKSQWLEQGNDACNG